MIETIYIAGAISPYPGREPVEDFLSNIEDGISASVDVFLAGFNPFSPFLDYQYFFRARAKGKRLSKDMIYKNSLVWLKRCDAMLVLPKYRKSEGTKKEITTAKEMGIPIFYSLEDLLDHCESEK